MSKEKTTTKQKSIYALYAISVDEAEDGRWFDFEGGVKIKIRRFSSKHSLDTRRRLEEPHTHFLKEPGGVIPMDIVEGILLDHTAQSLIVDWKNVVDREGDTLKCTEENILKVMGDKALAELYEKVVIIATNSDFYREKQEADAVKN